MNFLDAVLVFNLQHKFHMHFLRGQYLVPLMKNIVHIMKDRILRPIMYFSQAAKKKKNFFWITLDLKHQ